MNSENRFPISISVNPGEPIPQRMAELEKNGVKYMELSSGLLEGYENFSEKSVEIFKTAAQHGVTIRSVHLPFCPFELLDPASTDASVRKSFLNLQSEILKVSAERGVGILVVHPSGEPYEEKSRAENLKYSIESLGALNEVAKAAGVRLAVENLPRTCMCRDCKEIEMVAKALPDISFCFDTNHSLIDQNIDIMKTMGSRIIAIHVSDYDRVNERHLFPGHGVNDWEQIINALISVGYSGTWNYEIKDSEKLPISDFVKNYQMLFK